MTTVLKLTQRILRRWRSDGLAGVARAVRRKVMRGYDSGPVGDSWTEFMSWLTFANAGMLTRGNVDSFDYAIRNLPSKAPILEIGSFCGLSANTIVYLKQKYGVSNPLFTCDPWLFEGAESGGILADSTAITAADYREFVKGTFLRNVRFFSRDNLPFTIEACSDDFFSSWAATAAQEDVFGRTCQLGGPISFAYIDGHHQEDFVRRDFQNCDRYLEPHGFLLFDDSADGSAWEVCKVVTEALGTGRYEVVAKNPNYLLRKKKSE